MISKFFLFREIKKFPFFFLLLFVTLLLGTVGLTGIKIVSKQVQGKLRENAHHLLTSDLVVSARRDLFVSEKESLTKIMEDIPHEMYRVIDIYSMITRKSSEQGRLVEIRAVEKKYPFYGVMNLDQGEFSTQKFYLSDDLAQLWGIHGPEDFQIGALKLKSVAVVTKDSSVGLRGFSLAPRVYVPLSLIEKSGLLKTGATGNYAYHFYLPSLAQEEIKELKRELHRVLKDAAIRIVLPEDSSAQTGRVMNILSNFMALSALIGLILSLVGIFYLYQSHLVARLKDLCLLHLYGLPKGMIVWGVIGQFSLVFFLVFIVQFLIFAPLYQFLVPFLSRALGMELAVKFDPRLVMDQLPFLYLLTLTILMPLLFGLMRTPMGLQLKASKISMGRFRFYDFIPFMLCLFGYAGFLAQSWRTGSIFFAGLMLVFILSTGLIKLSQWFIKRTMLKDHLHFPGLEVALALRSIVRSGHRLTLSFLSLAMGATLISLILQLDYLIQKEFSQTTIRPGLFIFDIQEEQLPDLVVFSQKHKSPLDAITPMIRARLDLINGNKFVRGKSEFSIRDTEDDEESRARNTGLNLTIRGHLSNAEKIVKGRPFPVLNKNEDRLPYVSLEKRWAQRMGISIGDKLKFDVQGVPFEGVVRNFREVKWTSFYPNFFVSVEPGFIDEAPKTYLAVLPAGAAREKISYQQQAVTKFPNISFIDVEELVEKLSELFEKSRMAIELISWLSLGVGFVILYGLSHDQAYRRYYDIALMKSLGFSSTQLRLNLCYEFGLIFVLAMSLGFFLGWGMAQIIGIEVFKLGLSVSWIRIIFPALLLMFICLMTILVSSWRAIGARPKELLAE